MFRIQLKNQMEQREREQEPICPKGQGITELNPIQHLREELMLERVN